MARGGARAAALLAGAWLWSGCAEARPDLVLIVVDTLRSDRLSSYGHPVDTAPRMRALAESGVVFERAIAASSWTKTSMASLMTALSPDRHRVRRPVDFLSEELPTLASELTRVGYHSMGVNSNAWLQADHGFDHGFAVYGTRHFARADEVNAAALRAIDSAPDGPFFLYVHYMDVHAPYLSQSEVGPPVDVPGYGPMPDKELEERFRKQGLDGPAVRDRVLALYDAEIRAIDAAIGSLLDALSTRGRLDHAVVALTSDHGEAFREHGTTEHGWNLFPEVAEVPLLLSAPGLLPAGLRVPEQVRSIDLAPTLLELAGVPVPASFEGRSLVPIDATPRESRPAVSAVGLTDYLPDRDYVAVISPDHLYVRERIGDTVEFYDLRTDPGALRDLGRNHPDVERYAALEGPATSEAAMRVPLDDETKSELRALGYLVEE